MTRTARPFHVLVAGATMIVALAVGLSSQSSSMTAGIAVRLPAGADYASDVLADPWDMCNAEDISPEPR